jgi:hypothetical protein
LKFSNFSKKGSLPKKTSVTYWCRKCSCQSCRKSFAKFQANKNKFHKSKFTKQFNGIEIQLDDGENLVEVEEGCPFIVEDIVGDDDITQIHIIIANFKFITNLNQRFAASRNFLIYHKIIINIINFILIASIFLRN